MSYTRVELEEDVIKPILNQTMETQQDYQDWVINTILTYGSLNTLNLSTKFFITPPLFAVMCKYWGLVEYLLDCPDVLWDPPKPHGCNDCCIPLIYCIKHGKLNFAIKMIKKGANVNVTDKKRYTPLHWASRVKDSHPLKDELIKLLNGHTP
jgi:hypothetical protein